jgi:hypothetical protein
MTEDEIIETKAAWGKTFVEIIDPTKENHVFRVYFEQPQRTWVGLTEDEAIELLPVGDWEIESTLEFAKAIEAKLKQRNT